MTCFTATAEVSVLGFLNSSFKWNYFSHNKSQKEASTAFLLVFLYAGGDGYLQRIEYESFLRNYSFKFPNISFLEFFFLHQFSLKLYQQILLYTLGTVVVAHVLNVPESQLVSMSCAQFSFFVIPVATCMMGTYTSTCCDYLYSSLCWNKVIWELGIPCIMLLLLWLEVGFLLHHCSVLYLRCLFVTTFVFRYLTCQKVSPFFMYLQQRFTLVKFLCPAALEDSQKHC